MGRKQISHVPINRHFLLWCLTLSLAFNSISSACGQGLIGDRGFGWPSDSQFDECERSNKLNPKSINACEELAEMYYYRSQRSKSIELWRQAVKLRLEAQLRHPDLQGLANAYSQLGWQLMDNKEFNQAEIALLQAAEEWKLSMRIDESGNSQYRLEVDLDKLTECYADWGMADKARETYAQLVTQRKIPNDAHVNLYDLNEKLRRLGVIPEGACPTRKRRE